MTYHPAWPSPQQLAASLVEQQRDNPLDRLVTSALLLHHDLDRIADALERLASAVGTAYNAPDGTIQVGAEIANTVPMTTQTDLRALLRAMERDAAAVRRHLHAADERLLNVRGEDARLARDHVDQAKRVLSPLTAALRAVREGTTEKNP